MTNKIVRKNIILFYITAKNMNNFRKTLVNTIVLLWREETIYENWVAETQYQEEWEHKVRITSLSFKDLQFLEKTTDIQNQTLKMYWLLDSWIETKDKIKRNWQIFKVLSKYVAQNMNWPHHNKFYIQKIG